MKFKRTILVSAILATTFLAGCSSDNDDDDPVATGFEHNLADMQKVLNTNADIAFSAYTDSVATAVLLQTALTTFETTPNAANLQAAKDAWLVSREPYGQTEVYRFRDTPIDDESANGIGAPEGAINAWPLGEALIDYVVATGTDFNGGQIETDHTISGITDPLNTAAAVADDSDNIIGSAIAINTALLETTEAGDGADVVAGYHAIEFLLWGQDLDTNGAVTVGTNRDTAVKTHDAANIAAGGQRPLTDFMLNGTCTTGTAHTVDASNTPCQRRHDFMGVVVDKLIADLTEVRDQWDADTGAFRSTFTTVANVAEAKVKMLEIVNGMGGLSVGELAGERMQIAFSANSQEDEHSCFSDNTHRDIVLNSLGVVNAYNGEYAGYDSSLNGTADVTTNAVDGYGLKDYLMDHGATTLAGEVTTALALTATNTTEIDTLARAGSPVDVQIQTPISSDDPMGKTILSLNAQGVKFVEIASDLGLGNASIDDFEDTDCDTTDPTTQC